LEMADPIAANASKAPKIMSEIVMM